MSIESNLKSIAESLATIAVHISNPQTTTEVVPPKPAVETPMSPAPSPATAPAAPAALAPAPVAPSVVASPSSPAPAPTAIATAAETMTVEELNSALVVEYHRIGSREGIEKCMADLGASSVNQLAVENYSVLLAAVKAIAVAG